MSKDHKQLVTIAVEKVWPGMLLCAVIYYKPYCPKRILPC